MFRNLKIEWMKIKNYRVFQVFSALYLVGIVIIIYIFYRIYLSLIAELQRSVTGQNAEGRDVFQWFSPSNIWSTVCFFTSFLLYLPGMVIINLFINEVNFKTHRQNIIDGWKRETFIITKIQLILCISLVVTIMNFIATFVMFQVTGTDFTLEGAETLGLCFIQTFIYMMFALFLATIFRRSGIAIIVFFIYGLILELFLIWLLGKVIPGMGHFLPLQIADSLIILPRSRGWMYQNLPDMAVLLPAALAFAGLYIYFAIRKYKYDDL